MSSLVVLFFILPSFYHYYWYWEAAWYAFGWGGSYQRVWSVSSPILYLLFSVLNFNDFLYYAAWFVVPLLLLAAMLVEIKSPSRRRALGCFLIALVLTVMHLMLLESYYLPSLYGILIPTHTFNGDYYYEQLIPIHTVIIAIFTLFAFKNWRDASYDAGNRDDHDRIEGKVRPKSIIAWRTLIVSGILILVLVAIGAHCYQMQLALGVQQDAITAVVSGPFASTRYIFVVFGSVDEDKLGYGGEYSYAGFVTVAYVVKNVTVHTGVPWISNLTTRQIQFNYVSGPVCTPFATSSQSVLQPCFQQVIVVEAVNSPVTPADAWMWFDKYGPANSGGGFFLSPGKHLYFILATYVPIPILP